MELEIFSYTFCSLFLFLSVWSVRQYKISTIQKRKFPPGPWKLPIIGNMYQLVGSLPHRAFAKLAKKHGPFMHLQLGEISMLVVTSPRLAEEVMKTHDTAFAQRAQLLISHILFYDATDLLFSPYGDYWRQIRKVCMSEVLSASRVKSFSSIRGEEVSNLIESIRSSTGSIVDFTSSIKSLTGSIVSRAAFGGKYTDHEAFLSLTREALSLLSGFYVADFYPSLKILHIISGMKYKLLKLHRKTDEILDNIIEEHRKKKQAANKESLNGGSKEEREDLVDVLLQLQESGEIKHAITTNTLKAVIYDMYLAGTDTVAVTVEWVMSELMRNPRVMEKAQTEVRQTIKGEKTICEDDIQGLHYLKSVIKEALRLHSPAPLLLPRECREPCVIDGYNIPLKTQVVINAWAINRDPKHWCDAESFYPERFMNNNTFVDFKGNNFEYIPFGAGRRMCPGIVFAIANIELPLAQLLYHFNWQLPDGIKPENLDMTEGFGGIVGRKNSLKLIATPYNPLLDQVELNQRS